jgi:hypothetical protein
MQLKLFLALVAPAVVVLALGGWTVQGARWAFAAPLRALT